MKLHTFEGKAGNRRNLQSFTITGFSLHCRKPGWGGGQDVPNAIAPKVVLGKLGTFDPVEKGQVQGPPKTQNFHPPQIFRDLTPLSRSPTFSRRSSSVSRSEGARRSHDW